MEKKKKGSEWCFGPMNLKTLGPSEKLTYTHAPAAVQQESRFADAFEAAVFVDTQSIKAHVPDQTLVLVWRFNRNIC